MGIEIYILRPDQTDLSGTAAEDAATPADADYFHFEFEKRGKKIKNKIINTNLPNHKNLQISLKQIIRVEVFNKHFVGYLGDAETYQFEQALDYAIVEWGKLYPQKYSKVYRKIAGGAMFNGAYIWNGTALAAYQGMILNAEISEDDVNNITIESLTIGWGG